MAMHAGQRVNHQSTITTLSMPLLVPARGRQVQAEREAATSVWLRLIFAALLFEPWVRGVGFELSDDNCAIVRWRGSYMQGAQEAYRAQQAARSMAKCYLAGEGSAILTAIDFVLWLQRASNQRLFRKNLIRGITEVIKILDNFFKLSMHSTLALWRVHRILPLGR
jgi:type IV secretory pathway TraG/TraD family ATPase VirD4